MRPNCLIIQETDVTRSVHFFIILHITLQQPKPDSRPETLLPFQVALNKVEKRVFTRLSGARVLVVRKGKIRKSRHRFLRSLCPLAMPFHCGCKAPLPRTATIRGSNPTAKSGSDWPSPAWGPQRRKCEGRRLAFDWTNVEAWTQLRPTSYPPHTHTHKIK